MEEITVRGIKGGVLISLPEKPWYQQRDLLIAGVVTGSAFQASARLIQ